MCLRYPSYSLLASALLAASLTGQVHAQAAPDSSGPAPRSWLLKAGLSVTHLRYSHTATNWQLLMPATFGLERRLGSRYSAYAQLDTDWQLGSVTARRGRASGGKMASSLPAATLSLGGRLYYGRPVGAPPVRPGLGRYLALQAEAAFERPVPAGRSTYASQAASLTPALYVLWGVQNRWHSHLLADLNAGVGVLAPTHTTGGEASLVRHGWDVGLQANIRLYWDR